MNRSDALMQRFLALHPKLIDLSLDRIQGLLARLGHPERHLPPVIHVAGTNGKGSTIAFMRAALEAAGYGVHVYTSPHLVHFHERIRLAARDGSKLVSEDALVAAFEACEAANAGEPITFFEITTAAALKLFADNPADVLLLEVGLGGRLDTPNVVDQPLLTVITSISHDHAEFLGNTLTAIAREKAGILKRDVPCVMHSQPDEVRAVIESVARRLHAPLVIGNQDFAAYQENGRLVYQDENGLLDLPLPHLPGRHQHGNAAVAIAALRTQKKLPLSDAHFEKAMLNVEWPARLQRVVRGGVPALMPVGTEIWLDGGHNADGGRVIAEAMVEREERDPRPLVVVAGMLDTKDSDGFLHNFAGLARHVYAVPIMGSKAARPPEQVVAAAGNAGLPATAYDSLEAAFKAVSHDSDGKPTRVVITGSLYLAGEVLALNGTDPK